MKVYFETDELEHFYKTPLAEIRGKMKYPGTIIKQYKKAVQLFIAIERIDALNAFRSLRLERLKGDRAKDYSIRLNDQYRLIFRLINEDEIEVIVIREISKHYE
jgi:proteic killer suppression protein